MEVKELIKLNSREVRGNSNLMAIYIEAFEKQFGYKPNCVGCSFNSDFQKLKNALNSTSHSQFLKKEIMANTFKLRQVKGEILTYRKDGRTVRQYDNRMTEEFAIGYLSNGTEEEIQERKKMFKVLPKELADAKAKKEAEETAKEEKPKASSRKKKVDNE